MLLVEAGGTRATWLLMQAPVLPLAQHQHGTRHWASIASVVTVGLNPNQVPADELEREVLSRLRDALAQLPAQARDAAALRWYGAGCGNPENAERMKLALQATFLQEPETKALVAVGTDLDLVAATLAPQTIPIIIGIMGTGSAAAVAAHGKVLKQATSTGFWTGDFGSGAWLGKSLVLAMDNGSLPDHLSTLLREALQKVGAVPDELDQYSGWLTTHPHPQRVAGAVLTQLLPLLPNQSLLGYPWTAALVRAGTRSFLQDQLLPLALEYDTYQVQLVGSVALALEHVISEEFTDFGFANVGPIHASVASKLMAEGFVEAK